MSVMDRNPGELTELRSRLTRRLEDFGVRVRQRLVLEGAAWCVAIAAGALLLTFLLDRVLRLSSITRRGLLLAFLLLVGFEAWRRIIRPMRLKLRPDVLAAALEKKAGHSIAARVATVLELPSQMAEVEDATSPVMVEEAVRMSERDLSQIDFGTHLDDRRKNKSFGTIGGIIAVVMLLAVLWPRPMKLWAARLFLGSNEPWPQRNRLVIAGLKDGVMTVPRGEAFAMRVSVMEGYSAPESVSIRWQPEGGSRVNGVLARFGDADFRYDFPPVESETVAELVGGDDRLGPVTIRPVDRPRFVDLTLAAKHPSESQAKTYDFAGSESADLSFLSLTELELRFTANTPIAQVRVRSSTTKPAEPDVRRLNERQFAIAWQHVAAVQTELELVSADAGLLSVPTSVSIGLRNDAPPRVTLAFSGVRQRITPVATIPLVAEARDDSGIAKIELALKADLPDSEDPAKVESSATTQPVFGPATQPADLHTEVRQPHTLRAEDLKLVPGHLLTIIANASDTRYVGAQTAHSRPLAFRVVRAEDLFKEILLRQQAERAKYRKQIEASKLVRETLGKPMDAPTITDVSGRHRDVQREVSRIQVALSDSLVEMKLNLLATEEAWSLMERSILEPMKALDTDLMRPQRDGLEVLRPDDAPGVAAAIDRQDQIILRLEDILRQMSQWDSFIDVLNQLNEIIRVQRQVEQETGKLQKERERGVFD